MSPAKLGVGPLEMEVIGILNGQTDLSVADIQAHLKRSGETLAYTTVMTVVSRLYEKGLVTRRKEGRQYLYSPANSQRNRSGTSAGILQKVKKSLFGSDRLKPILALLDSGDDLTADELRELKKAVEAKLKKRDV